MGVGDRLRDGSGCVVVRGLGIFGDVFWGRGVVVHLWEKLAIAAGM